MADFMSFWQAYGGLSAQNQFLLGFALFVAFAFEFINGFHDTANAVTTVIYTKTLKPTPAVLFSGFCNFLGVLVGGTAVAFTIVHLLPAEVLANERSTQLIVMVVSLLLAGVAWNLGTWWYGLPVSSSHTLIGSIIGVALAYSVLTHGDLTQVNWAKAKDVGWALLISPMIGFASAAALLLVIKNFFRDPRLHNPPGEGEAPPSWIRAVLLATCGGVSFAHGSNDGQKGMGLIVLALIGFLPAYYALDTNNAGTAQNVKQAALKIQTALSDSEVMNTGTVSEDLDKIIAGIGSVESLKDIELARRGELRNSILLLEKQLKESKSKLSVSASKEVTSSLKSLMGATEHVPIWVILGVALALGIGTTIGYKRIVVTVAEKIGKTHMTYAQGAAAEMVAATTIGLADYFHQPVSTTHVLSSGVAGTMWANKSGLQGDTVKKIGLAWLLTLPAAIFLAASLYTLGHFVSGGEVGKATKQVNAAGGATTAPAPGR